MHQLFVEKKGVQNVTENQSKFIQVIERQKLLIKLAKQNDVPILVIEYSECGPTNSELLKEIGHYKKAHKITKFKNGIFSSKIVADAIREYLDGQKISELVIAGANGGVCVKCSIEEAVQNGYKVWADLQGIIDFNSKDFILPYYYQGGELKLSAEELTANFKQTVEMRQRRMRF
jgi:nicotinamidase-related amidase